MTILNQPCPECFREEDGKWEYPCPSDDCVLHAINVTAAPEMLEALQEIVQLQDTEAYDLQARDSMAAIARAAIDKATK
jgi:hypothetical protein